MKEVPRRFFLRSLATTSAITGMGSFSILNAKIIEPKINNESNRFKFSLNAYSFNEPLRSGKTNYDEMIEFCAKHSFDAIDMTGYYFPRYPEVPTDEYIYHVKRKAHSLGIAISGTGIRTEFGEADPLKRGAEIMLVKKWIEVAAKLGAPVIRIFTAKALPQNYTWDKASEWITNDIKTCVEYGKQHGVIVAVQNHNDFIKTADQAISILKNINSEWFGLVLDTGSFITLDPYQEIQKTVAYAVNWQIKEKVAVNGKIEMMDLEKLFRIIVDSNYRGYLPIETLSAGDPFEIVPLFFKLVKEAMHKVQDSQ